MTEFTTPKAPWRIGVDVGGTFTDMVLRDAAGAVRLFKSPSVPADPSEGVIDVLRLAARQLDFTMEQLLGNCTLFVHGSTVATNTILEKKGARVGLITTEGFRDSLEIRRGIRANPWDHRAPPPDVLVPRYLRLPVRGRLGPDGAQLAPLCLEDVDAAAEVFREEGVESVAVCLFNSFLNGEHERAVAERLRQSWGGGWISLSSDIMPTMGEYERGLTAVINAYVAPKVSGYIRTLDQQLNSYGLSRPLLMVQSNGGSISAAQVASRPVMLVLSGPAAAVGALQRCATRHDEANFISMEIGGTSCDVMVMTQGSVPVADELVIDDYHLTTPSVEIHTVGAGSGTIAWVDDAGLLHVGPQGAGARPGPAAYGFGGEQPTVTDAEVVLGRLRPGLLASGAVKLDADLARQAIERHVSGPLGLSVEDAAAGIIRLLEQTMLHAVEKLSIERGLDPKDYTLVAAGGAGPMHGASVARLLGCRRMLLPRAAGAFCALGMLESDVRQDYLQVFSCDLDAIDESAVQTGYARLQARAEAVLERDGFHGENAIIERELDLLYADQQWPVRVAIDAGPVDAVKVRAAFEAAHQRLFGHIQPNGKININALRVIGRGRLQWAPAATATRQNASPPAGEKRKVWIDPALGWQEVPVYRGADLRPGCRLEGPLLVEELTTTAYIGPGDVLEVDDRNDFLIHLGAAPAIQRAPAAGRCATEADNDPDPVMLALVQNRLDHISRQMGWVMTRTARSPIFSQSHDFACFMTDARGNVLSQADGLPIHTGGGGVAVRALLRDFEGRIHPGDVFLQSDPYTAGGNHLPDWLISRPVFANGQLMGFVCNRGHQADIGGGAAGTYNAAATEIFHEGIRLPVLKLIERGDMRDDLWRLLLINTRAPEMLDGDARAMIGSTEIGAERLALLVEELGAGRAQLVFEEILDYADRRLRSCIERLKPGVYRVDEPVDHDCFKDIDARIVLTMTVKGSRLIFDFAGTSSQMRGFKNSSVANSISAVSMGVMSFFEPDLPKNEGAFRSLDIRLPEGSLMNARAPAPMTMNTVFIGHQIVHAVWKALGLAMPERATAGWSKSVHPVTSGYRPDGSRYVMYQWAGGPAGGAVEGRDGFHLIGTLTTLGGLTLPNLEAYEQLYPVRFIRQELREDGAGAGRWRGGAGCDYAVEVHVPADYAFRGEGVGAPSGFGVAGGKAGAGGHVGFILQDGTPFEPPRYGLSHLPPGTYKGLSPGGGGYGDPRTRPASKVLRDVRDGIVSRAAAEREYGVVLTRDGHAVDEARTARLRSANVVAQHDAVHQ